MKHLCFLFCALLTAIPVLGQQLSVATLHPLLTDLAAQVGGKKITLHAMMPAGVDVHAFNPTPAQMKAMSKCQLVLACGKHLEAYLDKLKENVSSSTRIVEVGRTIPSLKIDAKDAIFFCCPEHAAGAIDPHWWNSLDNMIRAAGIVADEFGKSDPTNLESYQTNAKAYKATLSELKKWAKKEISTIPSKQRIIPTSHLSLTYFAKEFGFKLLPIQGLNTQQNATSQDVAMAIKKIKENGIQVIFPETGTNAKRIQEIVRETGTRMGGELIADGNGTGSQFGFVAGFQHNIKTLVAALRP